MRVIGTDGTIATVAGSGIGGFSGDGGPATQARLGTPRALARDPVGNLYIGDTFNNRIRKVTPLGTITTIAGTGTAGSGCDGGPAAATSVNNPRGVAATVNELYLAEVNGQRMRLVR